MNGLSRYAAVGFVATACHYGLLLLLVEAASVAPSVAAFSGSIVGAVVAYVGNRHFTFTRSETPHAGALPRFAAVAAQGAMLNALIVGGGAMLGIHYLLMQIVASVSVMVGTYSLNQIWTFRQR